MIDYEAATEAYESEDMNPQLSSEQIHRIVDAALDDEPLYRCPGCSNNSCWACEKMIQVWPVKDSDEGT